jgi:hypothetical protein
MALGDAQVAFALVVAAGLLFAAYTAVFGPLTARARGTSVERPVAAVDTAVGYTTVAALSAALWLGALVAVDDRWTLPRVTLGLLDAVGVPATLGGVPTWYAVVLGVATAAVGFDATDDARGRWIASV